MNEEEPGGFLPPQIPGLVFWVRADKGITLGLLTAVSAWADQSGTGDVNKNLSQGTTLNQPTLNASDAAYNNRPSLSFLHTAASQLISGTWSAAIAQPYTVFIVGNDDGTSTTQYYMDGGPPYNSTVLYNTGGEYGMYAGSTLLSGATSAAPRVLAGVFNGGSSAFYNSAKTPAITGAAGAATLNGISAGDYGGGGAFGLNGKICEIIAYSGALTAAQIATVLAYAGARYGIAIGS